MSMIPTDSTVWIAAFTFLGSCVTAFVACVKIWFLSKKRDDAHKASLDMSAEELKADRTIKLVAALKETVDRIAPLVQAHDTVVEALHMSVKGISVTEAEMTEMMKTLKIQYHDFHDRMNRASSGGSVLMQRLEKITTDVESLKSGNVFVRGKK